MMYCIWLYIHRMYWPVRFKRLSYANDHQLHYPESLCVLFLVHIQLRCGQFPI